MNITDLKANDLKLSVEIVSTSGISSCSPTLILSATLSTPIIEKDGCEFTASQGIHGSVKLRGLTDKLEELNETIESVNAHNNLVLNNCFNPLSSHYCFKKESQERFLDFHPVNFLITIVKRERALEVKEHELQTLQVIFKEKMAAILDLFLTGECPEFEQVKQNLKNLAEH